MSLGIEVLATNEVLQHAAVCCAGSAFKSRHLGLTFVLLSASVGYPDVC